MVRRKNPDFVLDAHRVFFFYLRFTGIYFHVLVIGVSSSCDDFDIFENVRRPRRLNDRLMQNPLKSSRVL